MTEVLTDELFRQPGMELADARAGHAPVRAYQFAFASPAHGGKLGATHCLELPFTFANWDRWAHAPFVDGIDTADFEKLGREMHDAWIGFIRTGDPNTGDIPSWPRTGPSGMSWCSTGRAAWRPTPCGSVASCTPGRVTSCGIGSLRRPAAPRDRGRR